MKGNTVHSATCGVVAGDGGGSGEKALETGLNEVRGVWFFPNGSYLLATHEGSQV